MQRDLNPALDLQGKCMPTPAKRCSRTIVAAANTSAEVPIAVKEKAKVPTELEKVFQACPAWMPDYFGNDRTPHVYGDMLRDLRESLGGRPANGRRKAKRAVTKRSCA